MNDINIFDTNNLSNYKSLVQNSNIHQALDTINSIHTTEPKDYRNGYHSLRTWVDYIKSVYGCDNLKEINTTQYWQDMARSKESDSAPHSIRQIADRIDKYTRKEEEEKLNYHIDEINASRDYANDILHPHPNKHIYTYLHFPNNIALNILLDIAIWGEWCRSKKNNENKNIPIPWIPLFELPDPTDFEYDSQYQDIKKDVMHSQIIEFIFNDKPNPLPNCILLTLSKYIYNNNWQEALTIIKNELTENKKNKKNHSKYYQLQLAEIWLNFQLNNYKKAISMCQTLVKSSESKYSHIVRVASIILLHHTQCIQADSISKDKYWLLTKTKYDEIQKQIFDLPQDQFPHDIEFKPRDADKLIVKEISKQYQNTLSYNLGNEDQENFLIPNITHEWIKSFLNIVAYGNLYMIDKLYEQLCYHFIIQWKLSSKNNNYFFHIYNLFIKCISFNNLSSTIVDTVIPILKNCPLHLIEDYISKETFYNNSFYSTNQLKWIQEIYILLPYEIKQNITNNIINILSNADKDYLSIYKDNPQNHVRPHEEYFKTLSKLLLSDENIWKEHENNIFTIWAYCFKNDIMYFNREDFIQQFFAKYNHRIKTNKIFIKNWEMFLEKIFTRKLEEEKDNTKKLPIHVQWKEYLTIGYAYINKKIPKSKLLFEKKYQWNYTSCYFYYNSHCLPKITEEKFLDLIELYKQDIDQFEKYCSNEKEHIVMKRSSQIGYKMNKMIEYSTLFPTYNSEIENLISETLAIIYKYPDSYIMDTFDILYFILHLQIQKNNFNQLLKSEFSKLIDTLNSMIDRIQTDQITYRSDLHKYSQVKDSIITLLELYCILFNYLKNGIPLDISVLLKFQKIRWYGHLGINFGLIDIIHSLLPKKICPVFYQYLTQLVHTSNLSVANKIIHIFKRICPQYKLYFEFIIENYQNFLPFNIYKQLQK